jgi:hypothetical protein
VDAGICRQGTITRCAAFPLIIVTTSTPQAKDVVTMSTAPMPVVKPGSGNVLVKVHACSFSPSDYRMMSGETDLIKKPKAWPYIPGMSNPQTLYRPGTVSPLLTECIGPPRRQCSVRPVQEVMCAAR